MEKKYFKYSVVMILLFLVGGFSCVLYIFAGYSFVWGFETFSFLRPRPGNASIDENRTLENRTIQPNPEAILVSPFALFFLIEGILSIAGGISLWQLIREKELTTVKENISSLLLTPEEKAIIDELKKAGGKLNQNQLVKKTGLSKVKVHRALVKLEIRKVVKKYPYGLTNKIILEKTAI